MESRSSHFLGFVLAALAPASVGAQLKLLDERHGLMPAGYEGATRDHGVADLDGDGHLDLLLGRLGPDAVLLGDGSGLFAELAGAVPAGDGTTYAVSLGDVDGDGDQDAVLHLAGPDALLLNGGAGRFATSALLPPEGDTGRDGDVVDVDLDGDLDLVVANEEQNRLFLGDGSGAFAEAFGALPLPPFFDEAQALAVLDIDLDGDPDFLFGGTDLSQLLRNDGAAGFSDQSAGLPVTGGSVYALAVGDVDADGDADVLAGPDSSVAAAELLFGDGAGGFALGLWPTEALGPFHAVALGDVDGDGDLDAYLGRHAEVSWTGLVPGTDAVYGNDGHGVFTASAATLPDLREATESVALVDVDGDGDLDALLGGRDRLLLGDGAGRLVLDPEPLPQRPQAGMPMAVATADVDGDGDLDAVQSGGLGDGFTTETHTFLGANDGTGFFLDVTDTALPPPVPGVPGATRDALFADVDGNGDPDLLLAIQKGQIGTDGGVHLLANHGGAFTDASAQVPWSAVAYDLAAGDVDGDGDADLVVASNPLDALLLNDGAGAFASVPEQIPQATGRDVTLACALGDVDLDGDLDLLLGNAGSAGLPSEPVPDALYRNDGAGTFTGASAQLPAYDGPAQTTAVALADLDRDGDLDAVIGRSGFGASDRLYENAGAGIFADVTAAKLPPSAYTQAIGVGDFDGNGWPDLLLSGRLRLGFGGVFLDAQALAPHADFTSGSIALGDLDGDSDLDLLLDGSEGFQGQGRVRLWRNTLHQTIRRGPARAGKPFALEVRGAPLAPFATAYAAAAGEIPLPPLGTLLLDPLSLHVLPPGALDGEGRALLVFAVPADPAAIGATLHAQSLVAGPTSFTNREAITLTGW